MGLRTKTETRTKERTRLAPRWNVVLLDDDDHSYGYVVEMLTTLLGHSEATAYRMAVEVDTTGRVIVWTDSRRGAERERERIQAYGADPRIRACRGSMTAVLEPAPGS